MRDSVIDLKQLVLAQKVVAILLVMIGLGSGCTARQLYDTGQSYRRNQCLYLADQGERETCLSKTITPYEEYSHEINAERK
jgi:hypothetical protein